MFILKFYEFNRINESDFNINQLNGWFITYNHNNKHDLNLRIAERSTIRSESDLKEILNQITYKLNQLNLRNSDLAFVSNRFNCKVIVNVSGGTIEITTFLKINYKTKITDKIIKI